MFNASPIVPAFVSFLFSTLFPLFFFFFFYHNLDRCCQTLFAFYLPYSFRIKKTIKTYKKRKIQLSFFLCSPYFQGLFCLSSRGQGGGGRAKRGGKVGRRQMRLFFYLVARSLSSVFFKKTSLGVPLLLDCLFFSNIYIYIYMYIHAYIHLCIPFSPAPTYPLRVPLMVSLSFWYFPEKRDKYSPDQAINNTMEVNEMEKRIANVCVESPQRNYIFFFVQQRQEKNKKKLYKTTNSQTVRRNKLGRQENTTHPKRERQNNNKSNPTRNDR